MFPLQSPSPAPVIQKPPIPQEHMPMVAAFDATVDRCRSAASTQVSVLFLLIAQVIGM